MSIVITIWITNLWECGPFYVVKKGGTISVDPILVLECSEYQSSTISYDTDEAP